MTYSKKELLNNVENTLPESEYNRENYSLIVNKQWQGYAKSDKIKKIFDKNKEF